MDYQDQLKLQAYLDGELPEREARRVADWVVRDGTAAALLAELRQTREALADFEAGVKLPESREFYWSKIQAAVERQEHRVADCPPVVPWFARLRRFLVPAAGLALVTAVALVGLRQTDNSSSYSTETALEDAQAFTYRDFRSGATLVWLSYPADQRIAGEEEFTILE